MKIKGLFNLSSTDHKDFTDKLIKTINELQKDGQTVEIQYQTNTFNNGQIVYSALLIGSE